MLESQETIGTFLLVLDLAGTFVFALSGGMAGVRFRLDLFGVLVVSVVAAMAGGIIRDVLIGALPPAAINDWRYVVVSCVAGLIAFRWHALIAKLQHPVLIFDGAGLALFAVTGTSKALAFQLDPLGAILLGVLTATGGGALRDVLVARPPVVLRSEIYAVTALAGAVVVAGGDRLDLSSRPVALAGAALCFGLRLAAIRRGWELPSAR
ncbi:MAG TPA: trimeric intracellular cation channel family protein [Thermomicrobiales bacterium]|nr:trimeric intracellular cation channel family protein [Thermomicrobiales bacterium]